jgi:Ca2+:H+ antiporter
VVLLPRLAFSSLLLASFLLLQIGLFAIPFVTIVGWVLGHPFSLGFDPFAGRAGLLACNALFP